MSVGDHPQHCACCVHRGESYKISEPSSLDLYRENQMLAAELAEAKKVIADLVLPRWKEVVAGQELTRLRMFLQEYSPSTQRALKEFDN